MDCPYRNMNRFLQYLNLNLNLDPVATEDGRLGVCSGVDEDLITDIKEKSSEFGLDITVEFNMDEPLADIYFKICMLEVKSG